MQDPKKYAEELVEKMRLSSLKMSKKDAVNCALVAVDKLIEAFKQLSIDESGSVNIDFGHGFYELVKNELENN